MKRARATHCAASVLCGVLAAARSGAEPPSVSSRREAVIYGDDDRTEVYAASSQRLRDLAHQSVLALVPTPKLIERADGSFEPDSAVLGGVLLCPPGSPCVSLCPDEPFIDQPSIAPCSGVLVDDDLVLSAGHCFNATSCDEYAFVFDYLYEGPRELGRIDAEDVHRCRRIVSQGDGSEEEAQDYALIQLDRPVGEGRRPVDLRSGGLVAGERVSAISFAFGLPAKVDQGGVVQETNESEQGYFTVTTDTSAGSSGAPIFDSQGRLAGHVTSGRTDFQVSFVDGVACLRSRVVPDETTAPVYERVVYSDAWRDVLCDSHWPGERLCGSSGGGCAVGGAAAGTSRLCLGWLAAYLWLTVRRRRTGRRVPPRCRNPRQAASQGNGTTKIEMSGGSEASSRS